MTITEAIDKLMILRGKYGGSVELAEIAEIAPGKFVIHTDVSFQLIKAPNERKVLETFLLFVTGSGLPPEAKPTLKLVR